MEKDLFCKIIDGEIPCHKVYEDEDVLAFLDISQITEGHTLVVPKKHYDNLLTTPQDVVHKVMDVAQRIGQVQIKMLGAKGVNIISNAYPAAGQSVLHFHVHVIPRYGNKKELVFVTNEKREGLNLPAIATAIKDHLK